MKVLVLGANNQEHEIDYDSIVNMMDDGIREDIHAIGITEPQLFVDEYAKRHIAHFGHAFTVD